MFFKRLVWLNGLAIILSAGFMVACGPSEEEQAATSVALTAAAATSTPTVTPTHTPTPTSTPTSTATPIPYDLSVLVAGEEDASIIGASVVLAEIGDEVGAQITDDVGQVFWFDLPGEEVNLSINAQGYYTLNVTESIERGINQIAATLERDPHGLLPSEACAPSERLLYVEDFQDGKAQGWAEIEARAQGWDITPHPDSPGNWVVSNSGAADPQTQLEDHTFDNAVWRTRFMPVGEPNYTFNWRFVTEPYETADGLVQFSNYGIGFHYPYFRAFRQVVPFSEVILMDILRLTRSGEWHNVEIATYRGVLEVWIDGSRLLSYRDPEPLVSGPIGLELFPPEADESIVFFDDLSVCELTGAFVPMPTAES